MGPPRPGNYLRHDVYPLHRPVFCGRRHAVMAYVRRHVGRDIS